MNMIKYESVLIAFISLCWSGTTSTENIPEVSAMVTDEVKLTFLINNFHGSGKPQNVSLTVGLFGDLAPMTVLNYVSLCKGYQKKEKNLHYVGSPVHRIVPDFVVQTGDVLDKDGTGGMSIYGTFFDDEPFILSHQGPGWLAMANSGPDSNASQFYFTLVKARWLNNKHVVFGKVISGMDVLVELGEVRANPNTGHPDRRVYISDCKRLPLSTAWEMTTEQMAANSDVKQPLQ